MPITTKRKKKVMLRFTEAEHQAHLEGKPTNMPLAVYLRDRLNHSADIRLAAAFILAALSADHTFEDALRLFDETMEGVNHGRG